MGEDPASPPEVSPVYTLLKRLAGRFVLSFMEQS